jgi:hypothetical protein
VIAEEHTMKKFDAINAVMASSNLIQEMSICVDSESGKSDLELFLVEKPFSRDGVRVIFRDVADMKCKLALGGGWTQVTMLGIREMKEGYERPYVSKKSSMIHSVSVVRQLN